MGLRRSRDEKSDFGSDESVSDEKDLFGSDEEMDASTKQGDTSNGDKVTSHFDVDREGLLCKDRSSCG